MRKYPELSMHAVAAPGAVRFVVRRQEGYVSALPLFAPFLDKVGAGGRILLRPFLHIEVMHHVSHRDSQSDLCLSRQL